MRIYTKLIILSLSLSILPLILVAGIFLYNAQKELTQEIFERLSAVSVLKKNSLEAFFTSRKEDLKAVQGFLDIKMNLPTLQEFDQDRTNFVYFQAALQLNDQLRAFMDSYQYADILLLDTDGTVVFVTNPAHSTTYLDKAIFKPADLRQARKGMYISDPVATKDLRYPYVLHMVA